MTRLDIEAGIQNQGRQAHVDMLRRQLHQVTRHAKKTFFQRRMNEAIGDRSFYKMLGWSRSIGQFQSPCLRRPNAAPAISANDKREALRLTHLPGDRSANDLPPPLLPVHSNLPWPPATRGEVESSIFSARNTAPGLDEIPSDAIKLAWPRLCNAIHSLFSLCLELGHHPTPFRSATLCVIEKSGRRDRSNPRSYRLIALLSVLGKGLERLVARRLAWVAVTRKVLPRNYFGALPGRSAADLATALVSELEDALSQRRTASLLTFDVEGGFDTVLPNRLLHRLVEQGWHSSAVSWTNSFLHGRTAAIRLDGSIGPQFSLQGSLPQGSPASPILFMLYMQPLFATRSSTGSRTHRGYADDGALVAVSPSLEENARILEVEFSHVLEWCRDNYVPHCCKQN